MNIKKILLVIAFIAFVLGMSFALWWVFFRPSPVTPPIDQNFNPGNIPGVNQNTGGNNVSTSTNPSDSPWQTIFKDKISQVANGGLTEVKTLNDNKVKGIAKTSDGVKYYDENKDQFFRINGQGQPELLTDKKFFEVSNVLWSPKDDKAILEYPDGMNILYNFRTNKQVTLPPELASFSFAPSGQQISATWLGANEEDNWLVLANDDGSGLSLLEPIGDEAADVQVGFSPDSQVAALFRKSVDLQRQEVYPIGLHGENLNSFTVNGSGFVSSWSPAGNSLLYSVYSDSTDYLPNLWVTNGQTSRLGDLKVSLNLATWPEKCTFSGENSLYCAVPQGLPRGAGLYPEIANSYPDNFYRVDLSTGSKTLIASPVGDLGGYTAYNLSVSDDGQFLYFTDQDSGLLQSIRLR